MAQEEEEVQGYTASGQDPDNYGSEAEEYKAASRAGMSFEQYSAMKDKGYSAADIQSLAEGGFLEPGKGAEEYLKTLRTAQGRAPDSAAVRDIYGQAGGLQAQVQGAAAASRDPFASARRALAERATSEIGIAGERAAQAQRSKERAQAQQLKKSLEMGAQISLQQAKLAEDQRQSLFGGGIGGLLGAALGAGIGMVPGFGLPAQLALLTGGGQLGSAIGSMVSDRRMKTNVRDGNASTEAMLDALSAKKYNKFGQEEIGVMAQDMEKTPQGQRMVQERNGVKVIDEKEAVRQLMTAAANLNERLSKLEKK